MGEYEAKGDKMIKYLDLIRKMRQQFDKFELYQVPRTSNEEADRLAKLASSLVPLRDRSISILMRDRPETEEAAEEIMMIDGEPRWKNAIETYLTTGSLPQDEKEAKAVRTRAARFTMIGGDLYKRGYSQPYLKCLAPSRAEHVLREIHEGSCGNQSGGRSPAGKVLRQGYFWPTLRSDAMELVRKCRKCQEHANVAHAPASQMQPISSLCPFDQWGTDIMGKLPRAVEQKEYLIVAVDYFSKWVEAEPLSKISENEVIKFVWKNIIYRFGIPRAFVTDNGTQFQGGKVQEMVSGVENQAIFHFRGNAPVKRASRGHQPDDTVASENMVGRSQRKLGGQAPGGPVGV